MKMTGFRSAPYDVAENAEDTLNCRRRHAMLLLSNEKCRLIEERPGQWTALPWAARAMVAQQILSMKLTGFRSAPYDAAENGERL